MTSIARKPMARAKQSLKSIDWSYPTSHNAERFGFKAGCWSVSVGRLASPPHAVAGFEKRSDAVRYAELLPFEWRGKAPTPED